MRRDDIEKAATQHANMIGWDHDPEETRGPFAYSFEKGAEWRINSVWHSITVIPDCHRFIVFLPKKSTIGSKNPIMGILEENRTFISSRPGCILCRLDEMESWAYLDDLLP